MWVSLVVILPLLWKSVTCQVAGYSIQVTTSVSVQEGLCVTIPCTFTAYSRKTFSKSTGFWLHLQDPFPSSYIVATNGKSRDAKKPNFHLTGNPDTGDCTLTITDARREDGGRYYFRFEDRKVKYGYNKEATTDVTVTDHTEEPVISDPGTVIAGVNKTLTCSPRNCSPTSLNFQWRKSDVDDVWMKNSSTVTFTPSIDDHQKNITCEMTNSMNKTTRKNVLLDVCCPTSITITWDSTGKRRNKTENVIRTEEGSSVVLKCLVESDLTLQNRTLQIIWTNEKSDILLNGTGKELELNLANMMTNHTGVYTCSVMTDYVIKSANISVTVQYPPRKMEITIQSSKGEELPANQTVVMNQTESMTLACKVDGNPPASVVWVKGEVEVETNKSTSPATINVTSSVIDVYRCLAWNAFGLKEQRIQVGIKPIVKPIKTEYMSFRDLTIAFLCGMSITILIILLYKLIKWKKLQKEKSYMKAQEPSTSLELPENEIYMNISKTEHNAEESADTSAQLDPNGVPSEDDLHYSTVTFTAKPSKVPPSQPETEYAEINVKN